MRKIYIALAWALAMVMTGCVSTKQMAQYQAQNARLEQRLDSVSQRLTAAEAQVTTLQKQVTDLSKKVQNAQSTKPQSSQQTTPTPTPVQPTTKKWNTVSVRGAKATVEFGGKTYKATCATMAQWDSIVVISISVVFGIEIARIEATPTEVIVINRLEKEYDRATYAEINQDVRPFVTYEDLRTLAGGEIPSVAKDGVLRYSAKGKTAALAMDFVNKPVFNQAVNITRADISKYKKIKMLR